MISTGGSSLLAVEALRKAGGRVAGVLALFTYGFSESQAAFDAADFPLKTLSNYEALLGEALSSGYIDQNEQALLANWRKDPVGWSDNFK